MVKRNLAGFTLVELLVVVVIIGMLVALLLPAVIGARASARRAQCTNNQKELAQAILQYEMAKQHFPGYTNRITYGVGPDDYRAASWATVVFPYMGREDLWHMWRDATAAEFSDPDFKADDVRVEQLVCPSDTPDEDTALSYVGNVGLEDATPFPNPDPDYSQCPPDWSANGIFHDHLREECQQPPRRAIVSLTSIKDGTQNTLLLSENIQAFSWNARDWYTAWPPQDHSSGYSPERFAGMVWNTQLAAVPTNARINENKDAISKATDITYARPSSNHTGGVVVSFCDGHQMFLREDIEYLTYCLLMSPNGAQCRYAGNTDLVDDDFRTTPLDDGMYK